METTSIAGCWPMTRLWSSSSIRISLAVSASVSLNTGMPVHIETMSAISSSPIGGRSVDSPASHCSASSRLRCVRRRSLSRRLAAFSNSWFSIASSLARRVSSISSSSSRYTGGEVIDLIRIRDAASSIRSIALSGRNRSEM